MKMNRSFTFLISISMLGCGSGPTINKTAVAVNAPSPLKTEVPAATPTPMYAEKMPPGAKITKPETVNFADDKFADTWQWIDPDGGSNPTQNEMQNTKFTMKIPTGKDLFGENRTAPRLVKAVTGDFQIETRVKFDPTEDYQGAGLLIYVDGMNYLRLERSFGGLREGGSGIRLDVRKHDQYDSLTTPGEVPTTSKEVGLKIIRRGNVFTAFWRTDDNTEWREVEEFASDFDETVQAGVVGCNTATEISVEFSYIRLLPQPLSNPLR